MQEEIGKWFYRGADGAEIGPVATGRLRALAVSGEISPGTSVRSESSDWKPAASVPECGFDCIALRLDPAPEALGPFPRECLSDPETVAALGKNAVLFFRAGTVADEIARAASEAEVVEPEIVDEPPRESPRASVSGMAALESQLRKELLMAGAVRGGAPLGGIFKKR